MPQLQLPIFPAGTTPITAELAFDCQDGKVIYLNGHLPVFQHAQEDLPAFRLFTSQLVVNGTVSQAEIARAFHVPPKTVKRYVKRLREGSSKSFFETPRRRSASVLKGSVKEQAQALLDAGQAVRHCLPRVQQSLRLLFHRPLEHRRRAPPRRLEKALRTAFPQTLHVTLHRFRRHVKRACNLGLTHRTCLLYTSDAAD